MDPAELPRDAARYITDGNLLKARQSTDNYRAVEIERDLFRSLFAIVTHRGGAGDVSFRSRNGRTHQVAADATSRAPVSESLSTSNSRPSRGQISRTYRFITSLRLSKLVANVKMLLVALPGVGSPRLRASIAKSLSAVRRDQPSDPESSSAYSEVDRGDQGHTPITNRGSPVLE